MIAPPVPLAGSLTVVRRPVGLRESEGERVSTEPRHTGVLGVCAGPARACHNDDPQNRNQRVNHLRALSGESNGSTEFTARRRQSADAADIARMVTGTQQSRSSGDWLSS